MAPSATTLAPAGTGAARLVLALAVVAAAMRGAGAAIDLAAPPPGMQAPITGQATGLPGPPYLYSALFLLSSDGARTWSDRTPSDGGPHGVSLAPDGSFFIAGWYRADADLHARHMLVAVVPDNFDASAVAGIQTRPLPDGLKRAAVQAAVLDRLTGRMAQNALSASNSAHAASTGTAGTSGTPAAGSGSGMYYYTPPPFVQATGQVGAFGVDGDDYATGWLRAKAAGFNFATVGSSPESGGGGDGYGPLEAGMAAAAAAGGGGAYDSLPSRYSSGVYEPGGVAPPVTPQASGPSKSLVIGLSVGGALAGLLTLFAFGLVMGRRAARRIGAPGGGASGGLPMHSPSAAGSGSGGLKRQPPGRSIRAPKGDYLDPAEAMMMLQSPSPKAAPSPPARRASQAVAPLGPDVTGAAAGTGAVAGGGDTDVSPADVAGALGGEGEGEPGADEEDAAAAAAAFSDAASGTNGNGKSVNHGGSVKDMEADSVSGDTPASGGGGGVRPATATGAAAAAAEAKPGGVPTGSRSPLMA